MKLRWFRGRGAAPLMAVAVAAFSCWTAPVLQAAGIEAFLRIQTNAGADVATDATHSWVELLGFEQGLEREVNIGSMVPTDEKTEGKRCTLIMRQDGAVANLMQACAQGGVRDLTIQVVRPAGEEEQPTVQVELRFEDAFVAAVKAELKEDTESPVFRVGLVYKQLTWSTTWFSDSKGTLKGQGQGFDFVTQEIFGGSTLVPKAGDYAAPVTPNPDGDGDGIPDAWETANGLSGTNATDANEDRDKDGHSNKEEYLAGTNPNSGASFFRVSASTAAPGQVRLTWNSVAGSSYKVWAGQGPGGSYTLLTTVSGVAGETSYTTTLANGKFFKVTTGE